MKVVEGENIAQYIGRNKETVNTNKGVKGKINELQGTSILLPIYYIRVSTLK